MGLGENRVDMKIQFISLNRNYFLWGPDTLGDAAAEYGTPNWEKYGWWADASGKLISGTRNGKLWG